MDATTWIDAFALELGVEPPTAEQKKALLSLASVAANASERLAAPISCWLLAVSGLSPEQGLALSRRLAEEAAETAPAAAPQPPKG